MSNNNLISNRPMTSCMKIDGSMDLHNLTSLHDDSCELTFREKHPGDHINIHDYDSLYEKGIAAGFSKIVESKKNGSVSIAMQGDEFDKTAPQMSLYVDMVK